LERRTDLEKETIEDVRTYIEEEFKKNDNLPFISI